MSAFDRLPQSYRELCEQIGRNSVRPKQRPLSPQNRRVRLVADLHLAKQQDFPNTMTRQQRRAAEKPWRERRKGV